MSSRLHTTLVYFGVVSDEAEEARLSDAPITGWRAFAVTIACAVIIAVAIGALVLLKMSGVSALLIGLFLVFEVTLIAKIATGRRDHE
ncbi:hypothetical protein EON79_18710 [bacterium]|nr:MAG: hypothetical protein EON79_18710 [bacterium]